MSGTKGSKKNIHFKENLKVYLDFLKKYKLIYITIFILTFIIEASSVVDKFLFKVIIDKGTAFSDKLLGREAFVNILLWAAAIFIAVIITKTILTFIQLHLLNKLEVNIVNDLKRKFYSHIIHLSHKFYTSHKTGSLISRLIRGGGAAERMTDVITFNTAPLIFQLIIVVSSLIYFDFKSAIVVFVTILAFIGYTLYIQTIQKPSNLLRTRKEDLEKAYISDSMTNIDQIKYFGKENIIKNKFYNLTEKTKNAYLKFWNYFRWLDAGQSFILWTGLLFLVYFPIKGFLDGNITIGSLVFIYTIYGNLIGPLFNFVHGIRSYYVAMADFEDLFEYGRIENDIKDNPNAKELSIKKGEIEFKKIKFKYNERSIFENFNLEVNKNEKVALVGHSGCGKTTLIKLLYRLYDVNEGEILIDGNNIKDFKQESLRSELSIVPQECILFDDTIYKNVEFSKPGAARKEVIDAIKFAQLDETIKKLPKKENAIVGERGVKLSGGEKQRVSIARAILADKRVLILDEATSHLDSKTEHDIQLALKNLMKNRTSIIIAHRLSTIMNADKIVVMDKGKIVQQGTHQELINTPGLYKKLWNLQKGGYIK